VRGAALNLLRPPRGNEASGAPYTAIAVFVNEVVVRSLAERVTVLTIPGGAAVPGPSGEQVTRSLQRNGIPTTLLSVELDGQDHPDDGGRTRVRSPDQGCLHASRLRQLIFGGATSHILANAKLPVLMAH
jgi:hypothetical protein